MDSRGIVANNIEKSMKSGISPLGELSHKDAVKEIAKSDVLVLPSKSEGLPRVIVEAFELGVPVICTPVGGIPDIVENYETGIFIHNNKTDILNALNDLYSNDELKRDISNAQIKQVDE